MPTYAYTGISRDGQERKGTLEADSVFAARRRLRDDGVFPVSIAEERPTARAFPSVSILGRQEVLPLVTRQLATLVGAGVAVVPALRSIASQVDDASTRRILVSVAESVQGGSTLARGLEAHPDFFPALYTSMVRAGEESGALPLALSRLADHLEGQARARGRVRAALTYPLIMSLVAALVVTFLLTFVVPKIVGVFSHLGRALPLPTRILIGITNLLGATWWALLILLAAAALWMRRYFATEKGMRVRDSLALRLPLIGKTLHLAALSRFARTLSTLVAGGIPVDRALRVVAPAVGNTVLSDRIEAVAARIVEGSRLADALKAHAEIPPTLVQMVSVGEESGTLEFILGKMADALDGEVEARTARTLALLEPSIILAMGLVVAFIVVSVLLPMLEISQIVR